MCFKYCGVDFEHQTKSFSSYLSVEQFKKVLSIKNLLVYRDIFASSKRKRKRKSTYKNASECEAHDVIPREIGLQDGTDGGKMVAVKRKRQNKDSRKQNGAKVQQKVSLREDDMQRDTDKRISQTASDTQNKDILQNSGAQGSGKNEYVATPEGVHTASTSGKGIMLFDKLVREQYESG